MPRVLKIDDEKWTQLFRHNCDELRFRFKEEYAAAKARKYGREAQDYVTEDIPGSQRRPTWSHHCAFPYAATLSVSNKRIKQSSVTTVIESVEYFEYVLGIVSKNSKEELAESDREKYRKHFLEDATSSIGKLVYYYATAFTTPALLKAETWEEAAKLHHSEIQKLSTNQFYLVRCHAADLIAKTLLDSYSSSGRLQRALIDYDPSSDHLISPSESANFRKVIARRIDQFPKTGSSG
jgi:hypothetical protein